MLHLNKWERIKTILKIPHSVHLVVWESLEQMQHRLAIYLLRQKEDFYGRGWAEILA